MELVLQFLYFKHLGTTRLLNALPRVHQPGKVGLRHSCQGQRPLPLPGLLCVRPPIPGQGEEVVPRWRCGRHEVDLDRVDGRVGDGRVALLERARRPPLPEQRQGEQLELQVDGTVGPQSASPQVGMAWEEGGVQGEGEDTAEDSAEDSAPRAEGSVAAGVALGKAAPDMPDAQDGETRGEGKAGVANEGARVRGGIHGPRLQRAVEARPT